MKADITRNTFNATQHYSRVLMQQGRVQLDADWNAQVDMHYHYLRRLAADLIGPCGGPLANLGFEISGLGTAIAPQTADFALSWGDYYVDGLLCEVEGTPIAVAGFPDKAGKKIKVALWTVDDLSFATGQYLELFDANPDTSATLPDPLLLRVTDVDYTNMALTVNADVSAFGNANPKVPSVRRVPTYLTQPDYAPISPPATNYHVYLDVWERFVGYVEDDSMREVALGGADTAARAKVVWQVKLLQTDATAVCLTPQGLRDLLQPANLARLKARAQPVQTSDDPCTIAPDALYRGPENQCYRVEVHTGTVDGSGTALGGNGGPTFKWSRENGDVVFAIQSGGGTNALTLEGLGRDDRFGLAEGDFVEVQDDDYVLGDVPSPLLKVQSIDRARLTVVLTGKPNPNVGNDPTRHPLLRRWDHKEGDASVGGLTLAADNAAEIPSGDPGPGTWLALEDGVQVQFSDPTKTVYRTGDYWLIPARVATGDVEWPSDTVPAGAKNGPDKVALLPMGVEHHYAPLALLTVNPDNSITSSPCLSQFKQLATPLRQAFHEGLRQAAPAAAAPAPATAAPVAANPIPPVTEVTPKVPVGAPVQGVVVEAEPSEQVAVEAQPAVAQSATKAAPAIKATARKAVAAAPAPAAQPAPAPTTKT